MDELIIASTTDTEAQIRAALEPREDKTPALSETDRTDESAPPPPTPAAPEETPEQPAEAAAAAPTEGEPPPPPKKKSRSEERINELTREKYLAQRKAERLEAELASVRQQQEQAYQQQQQYWQQQQQHQQQPAAPTAIRKPDIKDYAVYEDFVDATSRWNAQQVAGEAMQALRMQDAQAVAYQQQQAVLTHFEAAKTGARERYPDFDQVMTSDVAVQMPLNDQMQSVITTSPVGHDIAYYLVQHPDVAAAIQQQGPDDAWRTLGRLEERIALALQVPAAASGNGGARQRVTGAPPPVSPVGGGHSTATSVPDDQLSYREFKAKRDREEHQRRLSRR